MTGPAPEFPAEAELTNVLGARGLLAHGRPPAAHQFSPGSRGRGNALVPKLLTVPAGVTFTRPTPRGHTVLAYVTGGKAVFCQQSDPYSYEAEGGNYFDMERDALLGDGHMVLFDDGDSVTICAGDEPVRFLLISGKPIREPIAWHGPIVMNTQEELRLAYQELQNGTFVRVRGHGEGKS